MKERGPGDSKQMVQSRSKSKLDSWQPAWTESHWTQRFWKATRRLDQRAKADLQPKDKETNSPQGVEAAGWTGRKKETAPKVHTAAGQVLRVSAEALRVTCSTAAAKRQ